MKMVTEFTGDSHTYNVINYIGDKFVTQEIKFSRYRKKENNPQKNTVVWKGDYVRKVNIFVHQLAKIGMKNIQFEVQNQIQYLLGIKDILVKKLLNN